MGGFTTEARRTRRGENLLNRGGAETRREEREKVKAKVKLKGMIEGAEFPRVIDFQRH